MAEHSYLCTHDLSAEHLLIDLSEAAVERHGMASEGQDRRGITLVKQGGLNVVLTHLHAGGSLAEHSAPGAKVQDLDGHVPAGRLVAFDAKVRHDVQATEASTLPLTMVEAS